MFREAFTANGTALGKANDAVGEYQLSSYAKSSEAVYPTANDNLWGR
jgi:hypothetical protein